MKHLYVHVPFCDAICSYCDFARVVKNEVLTGQWLKRITEELERLPDLPVQTVYVGGGTPSCLSYDKQETLLRTLRRFGKAEEFTMEANPENVCDKLSVLWAENGVNRVSLGVQSFQSEILKTMNRRHDEKTIRQAIDSLRRAGITNISIDLMYGVPKQTEENWMEDLQIAVSLPVTHVSLYSLTIEPHSVWGRQQVEKPDEDLECDLYEMAIAYLQQHGFEQYEVSNFARNGNVSLHNTGYWHYDDFYGVGMGASGKENHCRYDNTRNLKQYLDGVKREETVLSHTDECFEAVMMGLRLKEGMNLEDYYNRYGENLYALYKPAIDKHIRLGNLLLTDTHLKTTSQGFFLLHEILVDFL
ncbi:MAG: radical SAM family heme chaperone HemW [Erysipelotrichaceae bacterium]|nr:radical SAM family heme chaperone HemW [Erysipelotrichaceae bacterium]